MKRIIDVLVAGFGLVLLSPILLPVLCLIWLEDRSSPFYCATRVGKDGVLFRIVKLRSMVLNADASGVNSTGENDCRITAMGRFVRRYKLDELPQLWNVLIGTMSLVGPRPQVEADVALYTDVERKLLSVRPGITDIASIVFSDEGEILKDRENPDLTYDQIIRPWKGRLGLVCVENMSVLLDLKLICLTVVCILSRRRALSGLQYILSDLNVDRRLRMVAKRSTELYAYPPPGSPDIVGVSTVSNHKEVA